MDSKKNLMIKNVASKEDADRCIEILKQRYSQQKKPLGLRQLIDENPDLPIRKLNTYLKEQGEEKPERFYIRNCIMRGLETDMKEFVLCNVMLQEVPCWSIAVRDVADIQPGENVKVEGGGLFVGPLIETRKCLGIDAPQPIDQIRYHCYGRTQLPVTRSAAAVKRWPFADPVDDTIPEDFVPASAGKFQKSAILDFEIRNSSGDRNYDLAQIRFRGLLPELHKLQKYLEAAGKKEYEVSAAEDNVAELVISCYEVKEEFTALISKFPALKVTGLVENWGGYTVLAFYSESGFGVVTKVAEKGYFDPDDDGGDGRWAYDIDMMGRKTVSFDHTQTSEEVRFVYSYPFKKLWETNSYVREKDGVIYVKTVKK